MDAQAAMNENVEQKYSQSDADKNAGRKHYSTFNATIFVMKIMLAAITIYISIAFGYAVFLPYEYGRERANFLHTAVTSLLQPYMDLAGHGKISHYYDWREIGSNEIADNYATLRIHSSLAQKQDYDSKKSQILFDFHQSSEAVVVEPSNYTGTWSLVKCTAAKPGSQEKICLRSNLEHKGKIRYSIDGESEIWGVDSDNKQIVLKSDNYINVKDKRNLPLI